MCESENYDLFPIRLAAEWLIHLAIAQAAQPKHSHSAQNYSSNKRDRNRHLLTDERTASTRTEAITTNENRIAYQYPTSNCHSQPGKKNTMTLFSPR